MTPLNTEPTHAGSVQKTREYFQLLSDGKAPTRSLGLSVAVHVVLFSVVLLIPLLAPQTLRLNYREMLLTPPPPKPSETRQPLEVKLTPPKPKLVPPPPVVKKEAVVELPPAPPPKPAFRAPEPPRIEAIPKPEPPRATASVAPVNFDPKPVPAAPPVQPPVITNVFSTPAATVAAKPTRNAEVAGFGETTSTRDSSRTSKVEVASATGFGDVSGVGDRSTSKTRGGVQGGVVGGFEGGVVGGSRNPTTKGTVAAAGFATNSDAPKAASPAAQKELDPGRIEKPVEILAKPRPDYTDEARKMKIEGEVLVRVLFAASGEVRVLEVTRGLGYGLNESAIRAAQQIRFKPAQRAGQSVDSTAIVHIVFQLAY